MKLLYYLLPLLAGIAMSIQSGINGQLRSALQHPILAAFLSFLGGIIALGVLLLFSKQAFPTLQQFSDISFYKYTGGLLGAFVVTATILSIAKIGAADMFVLIIAGQLFTAVIMDHYGVLGVTQNPLTIQKLVGISLVVAGAYLVNKK
jgi:transporter family-2 protein